MGQRPALRVQIQEIKRQLFRMASMKILIVSLLLALLSVALTGCGDALTDAIEGAKDLAKNMTGAISDAVANATNATNTTRRLTASDIQVYADSVVSLVLRVLG